MATTTLPKDSIRSPIADEVGAAIYPIESNLSHRIQQIPFTTTMSPSHPDTFSPGSTEKVRKGEPSLWLQKPRRGCLERLANVGLPTLSRRGNLPALGFFPFPKKVSGREQIISPCPPEHTVLHNLLLTEGALWNESGDPARL